MKAHSSSHLPFLRFAVAAMLFWNAAKDAAAAAEKLPPLRVQRREGVVEIDNGLVKARFTAGKDGVKQEYLASRGREWILLAEGF